MKNFEVGDRVAFDFNGVRRHGEIVFAGEEFLYIQTVFSKFKIMIATGNIKRLVKKKRLTIWVNDCGNYLSTPFTNEYEAKNRAKQSPTFVRTIKFKECK